MAICYICYIDFDLHVQRFRTDANTKKIKQLNLKKN